MAIRILLPIQMIVIVALAAYAFAWKESAEAVGGLLCIEMMNRGRANAAGLLEEGKNGDAVPQLRTLLDEANGKGTVCDNGNFMNFEWSFPILLFAMGRPEPAVAKSFDLEVRTLLAIALGRSGDRTGRDKMIAELATLHRGGDLTSAMEYVETYESTVLGKGSR
jgi:hypothetical protein